MIAHDVIFFGLDLLECTPVPGLASAAQTLLKIWDAVQLVNVRRFIYYTEYILTLAQTNRLQCLRLTERAADNLLSVRQEVHDAGDEVGEELAVPYRRLLE